MKKGIFLFLLVFFLAYGICFAEGFEIGVSGLSLMAEGENVYTAGLNIAFSDFFNDFFGFGIYGNLYVLEWRYFFIPPIDLFFSSVIRIINNDKFSLPIALGLYIFNWLIFTDFGPGVNVSAEIKFNESLHLYLRLQGAYMILYNGVFTLTPSIGIGFGSS